ncbi:MAG: 4Fe-4S dicluster domain-containing protein [Desulfovibrio sp.]|nr:4Fe-4S dicluster domain-containing protein [Desulfovibrio sp.]
MNPYQDLLMQYGAYGCVECGKCVALCPMAETASPLSPELSPKGLVRQALNAVEAASMPALKHCLQCGSCSQTCPAKVDVAGLIKALRNEAGLEEAVCMLCGQALMPLSTLNYLNNAVGAAYEQKLVYPLLCPDCKRRAYVRNNSKSPR